MHKFYANARCRHPVQYILAGPGWICAGRRWFFGSVLLANGVDVVDSLLTGTSWALRPTYVVRVAVYVAAAVVGTLDGRRGVQLTIAIVMFALQVVYTWEELDILGSW